MEDALPKLIAIEPLFQERVWGGRKLESDFGYAIPDGPIGECWAISAHPHGDCRVADGAYEGMRLSELWESHRELFGAAPGERFPLLVKILDAAQDLSVQVHPDDAYAAEHEDGSLGKRECWYVLEAEPGARIVVGQKASSREEFEALSAQGRWDELLNYIPVHAGDFFAVEPGCVHALCKGAVILETQQSSDVTYRLYDYDRPGTDGKPRELHIERGLDVIDFAAEAPANGHVEADEVGGITHLLHNESFDVLRIRVAPDAPVELVRDWDYLCMSVVEGEGEIASGPERRELCKGDHLIACSPAEQIRLRGELELICSYVCR